MCPQNHYCCCCSPSLTFLPVERPRVAVSPPCDLAAPGPNLQHYSCSPQTPLLEKSPALQKERCAALNSPPVPTPLSQTLPNTLRNTTKHQLQPNSSDHTRNEIRRSHSRCVCLFSSCSYHPFVMDRPLIASASAANIIITSVVCVYRK